MAGALAAGAVSRFATDGRAKPWRLVRCFAGFVVSMVWIAAIADEVVSVLGVSDCSLCVVHANEQALGQILGLSDALIGLTSMSIAAK